MNNKERIERIILATKCYHTNLEQKNLLFVYNVDNNYKYIQVQFLKNNFLHLLGLDLCGLRKDEFYDASLAGRLSVTQFKVKNHFTDQKLEVIYRMTNIHKKASLLGIYNGKMPILHTEKIVGMKKACMGFVCDKSGYYVPNTVLQQDISKLVDEPFPVVAVFRKNITDTLYSELCSFAENYDVRNLPMNIKRFLSNSLLPPEEQFYDEDYDEWYKQEQTDGIGLC